MNKSLLDTDTLSEIGRGIDPIVSRNALVYRGLFGRFTLSSVTLTEVVRGYQRKQENRRRVRIREARALMPARSRKEDADRAPGTR